MKKSIPAVLLFLILLSACSQKSADSSPVVAKVGKEKITFRELQNSVLLNPQFSTRTPLREVRQSQLAYLIRQAHLFLASERVGLSKDPDIQPKLKYIREQETLKAFVKEKFLDSVKVSDLELLQGTAKINKRLKIQFVVAPSRGAADSLKDQPDGGADLTALASKISPNDSSINKRDDVGYISFGDLDPGLEEAVYSLQPNQVCDPVKVKDSYYIVKLLAIEPNPAVSSMSSQMVTQDVLEIIRNRKADKIIRAYLEKLADGRKIQINNRVLDVLEKETRSVMGAKYDKPSIFKPAINNGELGAIQIGIIDVLKKPLARFGDQEMTVEDFMNRLKEMPPFHRPYLRTRARMIQSIIDIIRGDMLIGEAMKAGIEKQAVARKNIQRESRDFLSGEFQRRIASPDYKERNPEEWQKLETALNSMVKKYPANINEQNLFHDVQDPDSIWVPAPVQVFLKSRYVW
ncbi:MAG: peptidylprolyl isomerase [Calditrichia bacterium]